MQQAGQFELSISNRAVSRLKREAGRKGALMHRNAFDVGISGQADAQLEMPGLADQHLLNTKTVIQFHPAWTTRARGGY